jgi:transcription initiation factor IIE alpha subunit
MMSLYSTARDVSTVLNHDQRVAAVTEGMRTRMLDDEGLETSMKIKTALRKEILRLLRDGKIIEGDKEGELWSVAEEGKRGMRL